MKRIAGRRPLSSAGDQQAYAQDRHGEKALDHHRPWFCIGFLSAHLSLSLPYGIISLRETIIPQRKHGAKEQGVTGKAKPLEG